MRYRFRDFVADQRAGELLKAGARVKLQAIHPVDRIASSLLVGKADPR